MRSSLLCAALACLSTLSCSHSRQQAVFIDPALATLTPPDTTILVGARLDKLRQTTTYQRHFANAHFPALDRFAQDTGLDPKKDLWEVLYASNGTESALMSRGRFSPLDMEPKIQRQGAMRTSYRGYTLIGDEHSSIFFMNQTTALAGSTSMLKRIIDRQNSAGGAGIPNSLLPLVKTVPPQSQFWAVFVGNNARVSVPDSSNLGNVNTILRSVSSGTLAADLRQGLDARAEVTCPSEADAKQMADSLNGIVTLGRAAAAKKPEVVKALDTIHVFLSQQRVQLTVNVPQDLVDHVVGTFSE